MLAFIHIEDTIGAEITAILRQSFGRNHCDLASWHQFGEETAVPHAGDLKRAMQFYPSLQSVAGHLVVPHCGYDRLRKDLRYFTLLCDPVERCAAHYERLVQTATRDMPPFKSWITQEKYHNWMTRRIAGTDRSDDAIQMLETRVGCTGLVECLDQSLLLLQRWANCPCLDIRYSSTPTRHFVQQQLLSNAASRRAIVNANQEDIRLYLYVTNELFPRQIAGYGSTLAADVEEFRQANNLRQRTPRHFQGRVLHHIYRRAAQVNTAIRRAA